MQKIIVVPTCRFSSGLDASFSQWVALDQAERKAAEDGQVFGCMSLADPAVIFAKRNVKLPMQAVFDTPVISCGLRDRVTFVVTSIVYKECDEGIVKQNFVQLPRVQVKVFLKGEPAGRKRIQ